MYRVAVFIDGGYLDRELDTKRQGHRIDFRKLVDNIVSKSGTDRNIVRWTPLVRQDSGQIKVGFCCPRGI